MHPLAPSRTPSHSTIFCTVTRTRKQCLLSSRKLIDRRPVYQLVRARQIGGDREAQSARHITLPLYTLVGERVERDRSLQMDPWPNRSCTFDCLAHCCVHVNTRPRSRSIRSELPPIGRTSTRSNRLLARIGHTPIAIAGTPAVAVHPRKFLILRRTLSHVTRDRMLNSDGTNIGAAQVVRNHWVHLDSRQYRRDEVHGALPGIVGTHPK